MSAQLLLISSPFTEPGGPLNESNRFVERLAKCKRHKALMITSAPKDVEFTEGFSDVIARKEK